jgi:transcriptional regulator with XRE-family HTH domain
VDNLLIFLNFRGIINVDKTKKGADFMNKKPKEKCSSRIYYALTLRKMKQSELCARTGIPKSAMSQYISGAFEPKQDRIFLIAEALNVSEAWLMGYDVPMERQQIATDKNLTDGEKLLLDLFRQVPEEMQDVVLDMVQVALKNRK